MANPTKHDSLMADGNGNALFGSQQTLVADVAAITNYTAHATGAVAVVSNAATDLDTTTTALALLEDEVTAMRVQVNLALDVLEAHGLMADA